MKTFILKYQVFDIYNKVIKSGKIKAKNKLSEFAAKCGLEDYCKNKYPDFYRLVVTECHEDFLGLSDIFNFNDMSRFNNMFK